MKEYPLICICTSSWSIFKRIISSQTLIILARNSKQNEKKIDVVNSLRELEKKKRNIWRNFFLLTTITSKTSFRGEVSPNKPAITTIIREKIRSIRVCAWLDRSSSKGNTRGWISRSWSLIEPCLLVNGRGKDRRGREFSTPLHSRARLSSASERDATNGGSVSNKSR